MALGRVGHPLEHCAVGRVFNVTEHHKVVTSIRAPSVTNDRHWERFGGREEGWKGVVGRLKATEGVDANRISAFKVANRVRVPDSHLSR